VSTRCAGTREPAQICRSAVPCRRAGRGGSRMPPPPPSSWPSRGRSLGGWHSACCVVFNGWLCIQPQPTATQSRVFADRGLQVAGDSRGRGPPGAAAGVRGMVAVEGQRLRGGAQRQPSAEEEQRPARAAGGGGESILRVDWVAVPKASRARRVNRSLLAASDSTRACWLSCWSATWRTWPRCVHRPSRIIGWCGSRCVHSCGRSD
jgi:hypothetical protein